MGILTTHRLTKKVIPETLQAVMDELARQRIAMNSPLKQGTLDRYVKGLHLFAVQQNFEFRLGGGMPTDAMCVGFLQDLKDRGKLNTGYGTHFITGLKKVAPLLQGDTDAILLLQARPTKEVIGPLTHTFLQQMHQLDRRGKGPRFAKKAVMVPATEQRLRALQGVVTRHIKFLRNSDTVSQPAQVADTLETELAKVFDATVELSVENRQALRYGTPRVNPNSRKNPNVQINAERAYRQEFIDYLCTKLKRTKDRKRALDKALQWAEEQDDFPAVEITRGAEGNANYISVAVGVLRGKLFKWTDLENGVVADSE